jgi:hypothetical protein
MDTTLECGFCCTRVENVGQGDLGPQPLDLTYPENRSPPLRGLWEQANNDPATSRFGR